jgi:beta-glucanase (GH16 family)
MVSAQTQYQISVINPTYCSDIKGDTIIQIQAPGLTTVTMHCWKSDATWGHDSVFPAFTLDGSGNGSLPFPGSKFPHGPLRIWLSGSSTGHVDQCYLNVYNTGGVSWNEGLPAPPALVAGMPVVFQDDFSTMPTISSSGAGATYHAHTKGGKDFSQLPFGDPTGSTNPFFQRDSYLRIRAQNDASRKTTGFISTIREDGTGIGVKYGYFECRFIAALCAGSWPAFWGCTYGSSGYSDELDPIEGYGNGPNDCHTGWHTWDNSNLGGGYLLDMLSIGGGANWSTTPHIYGLLVTARYISYYLDNIKYWEIPTSKYSKTDPFYPMINLAMGGGGWTFDMSRYNNRADMYVDYLRIFQYQDDLKLPYISTADGAYPDSLVITTQVGSGVVVHYTLDGSTPTASSPIAANNKITIKSSCTLSAIGIQSGVSSAVVVGHFAILHSVALPAKSGLQYKYYEYSGANWDSLAKHPLTALSPVKTGYVDSFGLGMQNRTDKFAVRFTGVIRIGIAGDYQFWTYSDAGSRLYLDNYLAVDNDGNHALSAVATGVVTLRPGAYKITVDYFQDTGAAALYVYYAGLGTLKSKIPRSVLFCDSGTSAVVTGPGAVRSMSGFKISYYPDKSAAIAVPLTGAYEVRLARMDGRVVKTIRADKPDVFTFTRQSLKPGLYLVTVTSRGRSVSKSMLLF